MVWPAAEIDVDEDLIRTLLLEQHPDLAGLPLEETNAGWDNTLWRLGHDLLVRLPRRAEGARLVVHEQRWLPELAARLPLPVPAPVRTGRPGDRYPWAWSVVPWFVGIPGDLAALTEPEDAAGRLGRFLRALHAAAPSEAPHNPWRGVPLVDRADNFDQRLASLGAEIDIDIGAVRRIWDRAVAVDRWAGAPVWLHGDMHPANTLIAGGTLAAVVDFGDLCCGDPATDVAGAWMLLPSPVMDVFTVAYGGIDEALEQRALGWATLFGLNFLDIGRRNRASYETVGRTTLARVIRHSETMQSLKDG